MGNLCQCVEDKVTKKMKLHCPDEKTEKMVVDKFHCTCEKSTGTTTAAPIPQEGDACTAQNCATGLACLAQVYADGKQVFSECAADSICLKGNVWIGNAPSGSDAECRANESCICKKAADSTDPLVKKYLAHKSRSLAIFV